MSKRFAQFGGSGGQTSPFAPGGSPEFRGGPSGTSGFGINDFSQDLGLDSIISRTHKSDILGFERPLETLLEIFHDQLEQDAPPYLLTFDERMKLDTKKKIRSKEQWLHDVGKEKDTEPIEPIKKKLKTVEQLLSKFRKNEDKDFSKLASVSAYEEGSLDTKLNKLHQNGPDSFYRREPSFKALDESLESVDDYDSEGDSMNLKKTRLTYPFTGQDYHYEQSDGPDKYWNEELSDKKFPNIHDQFEPGLLMNYPSPVDDTTHSDASKLYDLTSPMTEESKNNNQTLEDKLTKLKKKHNPKTLETQFGFLDWNKNTKEQWPEYNATPYPNDGFGTVENAELAGPGPAGAGAYPIAGYL